MSTAHETAPSASTNAGSILENAIDFIANAPEALAGKDHSLSSEIIDPITGLAINVVQEPARATGVLDGGGTPSGHSAPPAH